MLVSTLNMQASTSDLFVDEPIFDLTNLTEIRDIIVDKLTEFGATLKYEKDMISEVVYRYLARLKQLQEKGKYKIHDVHDKITHQHLEDELEYFNESMQNELLGFYGIDPLDSFADKMKKDPELYGLTYNAYKIYKRRYND